MLASAGMTELDASKMRLSGLVLLADSANMASSIKGDFDNAHQSQGICYSLLGSTPSDNIIGSWGFLIMRAKWSKPEPPDCAVVNVIARARKADVIVSFIVVSLVETEGVALAHWKRPVI